MLLAQNWPPSDAKSWLVIAFGVVLLFYMLFKGRRKKEDPLDKSTPRLSLAQQRSVERQMQNLLVELAEMSRQISGQLDTRAARLEQLLADADQRIAALRQLNAGKAEPADGQFPRAARDEPPAHAPAEDPRYADIYKRADAGASPGDIAAALSRPSGEIELILALRPRGNSA